MMNLPGVGFRFRPTDEELISYYLMLKINGFALPAGMDHVIRSVNFYDHNPEELMEESEEECYLFTEMEGSGKRSSRKTKLGGFWKATAKDKPVYDIGTGSVIIGHKRSLDFYHQENKNKKTAYKMHEYTSSCVNNTSNKQQMKYWVLNKIYKHKDGAGMKRIQLDYDDDYFWESPAAKRAKHDHSTLRVEHNQDELWQPNLPTLEQNHGHMGTNQQQLSTTQPQQNE